MESTFIHEVTYLSKSFDGTIEIDENNDGWVLRPTPMAITFQALDQTNRAQHKFHFRIVTFYSNAKKKGGFGSKELEFDIDTDELYDMTVEYLKKYTILDPASFTAQVREEVLNDFGALSSLSLWLLKEQFFPFFQKLAPTMQL